MRKFIVALSLGMAVMLCGCAADDRPIAPPDLSDVSETSNIIVSSSITVSAESSSDGSKVPTSEESFPVEQSSSSTEDTSNVVIADPSMSNVTVSVGNDFFIVGWAFEEAKAAGWNFSLDEEFVAPKSAYAKWIDLEKDGKVVSVSVYNNDAVSPKRVQDCQIYSVSTEEDGSSVSNVTTSEVKVGMSLYDAEGAMSFAQEKSMNNGYRSYLSKSGDVAYYFYFNPNTDVVTGVGIAVPTIGTGEIFA